MQKYWTQKVPRRSCRYVKVALYSLAVIILTCVLTLLPGRASADSQKQLPDKVFAAYLELYTDTEKQDPAKTALAHVPPGVSVLNLAFLAEDAHYDGSLNLTRTGLPQNGVPYDGALLKQAIALAHQKNKNLKILISVGGGAPDRKDETWKGFDPHSIAQFVRDFGLDGVDIDFEPREVNCQPHGKSMSCNTDKQIIQMIRKMRSALPRPAVLSMAVYGNGAYGVGKFKDSASNSWRGEPRGRGMLVKPLREVGRKLDMVNVMSYDMAADYDPQEAMRAYRQIYRGTLTLGVEVPPEPIHHLSMPELKSDIGFVKDGGADGIMLWSLQGPNGDAADANPSAQMIVSGVCAEHLTAGCLKETGDEATKPSSVDPRVFNSQQLKSVPASTEGAPSSAPPSSAGTGLQ